eukprot:115834-Amphidinium_carterae.1
MSLPELQDHSKKSRDTDDAYASAYTKADEMLRGMEDRKRAVMSYASDQNMAYCVGHLVQSKQRELALAVAHDVVSLYTCVYV